MKVICHNCGVEFNKQPGQVKKSPNHFCSKSCAAKRNNQITPKRQPSGRCVSCNRIILASQKYCSRECRLKTTSVQHTTTIGDYRKQHSKRNFHVNIRKQSRYEYMRSDKPKECFYCGYIKHIDVCHIRDISDFPDDTLIKEVNHIDNLIALCPTHHWEFDHNCLDEKRT